MLRISPKRKDEETVLPALRTKSILIATDAPESIRDIELALGKLNYSVKLAVFDGTRLSATPIEAPTAIICFFQNHIEKSQAIAKILKAHYSPQPVSIVGIIQAPLTRRDSVFDSVITHPAHASQIANRVNALVRLSVMEQEISLRMDTLKEDFGQTVIIEDDGEHQPFRILFIGKATPSFMVVINALQKKNVEVVAAFTSFSAFDYLHETDFDAVVMNAIKEPEPALSISETMRRNARLYNVPTLFLVEEETFDYEDVAYNSGASDIINVGSDADEISGRILELANYHRIHSELKQAFENLGDQGGVSAESGCYTKAFMDKHIGRVFRHAKLTKAPISLIHIKLSTPMSAMVDAVYLEKAISKIGKMMKNIIRMQDTISHCGYSKYLLMFPDTNKLEAKLIIDRVKALGEASIFDAGENLEPFSMSIEATIIEMDKTPAGKMVVKSINGNENNPDLTNTTQAFG